MKKLVYRWQYWTESGTRWAGLLPTTETNPYAMSRIASIYRRENGQYNGSYFYPHSTGHKQGGSVVQKTLAGTQRYLERQLSHFWEPPRIVNSRTRELFP